MSFNPGNDSLAQSSDVSLSNPSDQHVLSYSSSTAKWVNTPLPAPVDATAAAKGVIMLGGDLAGTATAPTVPGLATKADSAHNHTAADIDSGTISIARIPTGTTSTTVSLGNHSHTSATTTVAGFMSVTDKTKLDGVATGANNYTHPSGDGNLHVPATSTINNGRVLKAGATAGAISWGTLSATDVGAAPASHAHVAADVTSGTFDIARIPTGSTATTVALGNHTHSGFAATAHTHAATDIASGTVATARLGSGTASSSTYLRGDGTWAATPSATNATTTAVGVVQLAGDLAGTATAPSVEKIKGVTLPSTAPANGQVLTATGTSTTSWSTPTSSTSVYTPVQRSANYTAANRDFVVCNASAGGFTVSLPAATAGAQVRVLKTDASTNSVVVMGNGNATLAGSVSYSVNQRWMSQDFAADGTNWYCV